MCLHLDKTTMTVWIHVIRFAVLTTFSALYLFQVDVTASSSIMQSRAGPSRGLVRCHSPS